jgi:hypothetical protein
VTAPFVLHEQPQLDDPVLVVMLLGWIDAGTAGATAMGVLQGELAGRRIATFDGDTFIDYRARRPLLQLREGVNTNLVWPELRLDAARDPEGHDVLLLTGHEPDMAWHLFCDAMVGLAADLGVRKAVGLGAYPFAAPHTRPSRLSITAATPEVAATVPYLRNSVDVPAGIEAALERRFAEADIPALGLWAQVPHYVANYPYPAAAVSLLQGLREVAGVSVSGTALADEATAHRQQLDTLVANSDEHVTMVHQLEQVYDAESESQPDISGPLPTGDELAAELERYLREQGK